MIGVPGSFALKTVAHKLWRSREVEKRGLSRKFPPSYIGVTCVKSVRVNGSCLGWTRATTAIGGDANEKFSTNIPAKMKHNTTELG